MSSDRQVMERDIRQGEDERIVYSVDVSRWTSSPTLEACKAYEMTGDVRTDVTETVLTGSGSVAGNVITLPALSGLAAGKVYRVEVKFSSGGNTFETYFYVKGEL